MISVEDDGKGFDPLSIETGGMGLRIMRYRAKMINGTLEVAAPAAAERSSPARCALKTPSLDKDKTYDSRSQIIGSKNSQGASSIWLTITRSSARDLGN